MLRLVVQRAWVQRWLLSAVVLLVAVATTLMGFYALLLGVAGPRAFSEQVQRSQPSDVDVTAYVVGLSGRDLDAARQDARGVVQGVLGRLHPSLVSTATSQMRQIGDSGRLGYLATTDAVTGRGTLTSGRWPHDGGTGPVEAVAPDAAARALDLHVGDRLALGPGPGLGQGDQTATIVIVGTFRGLPSAAAESDPLSGAGFDPTYPVRGGAAAASGPYLVGGAAFVATGLDVASLRVDGSPDLGAADDATLRSAVVSLGSAYALLSERVRGSADVARVESDLPATLDRLHAQQDTTRSAVLVALLLDTMLGLAALVLAGRLLADTRAGERELMTALGIGRGHQLGSAVIESALLAAAAAVLAVPGAAAAYALVTHLPGLGATRLAQAPTVTTGLVVTAVVGAAALTLVLVVSPLVGRETGRPPGRRRAWARSAVDVLLLGVAVAAWWQLRARHETAVGGDTLLVLAPALFLAAVTVVAVRCLPPLFALAATAASRTRSLLLVALDPSALRLNAGTALVLLSLASATATFGVAVHTTWQRSQGDQADLRVGTDLSLALDAPPTSAGAVSIARAATARSIVSPVTARPVALGDYRGAQGDPPQLVALDTRHANDLLRGRLEGATTWSDVGRLLMPAAPVRGIRMPADGAGVTMVGSAPPGVAVSVTPSVVVQDATGLRSTLDAAPIAVDGRPHVLRWSALPLPDQRIVAVRLAYADAGSSDVGGDVGSAVSVALRVPGQRDEAAGWQARVLGPDGLGSDGVLFDPSISVRRSGTDAVLTTRTQVHASYLVYDGGAIVATAFDPPSAVPVAVSQALVDAIDTKIGGELSATVGNSAVQLRVVEIVPAVPSAPRRIAVLADVDALSRALISTGNLEPAVDAFWVARPTASTASALGELALGTVTTRDAVASELSEGPMQVTLPVAYVTVAGSAVLLLLAGAVLVVSADQRRRTAEVGRLRALGLPRSGARRLVLAQHGLLLVALVLTGALVGGAAAVALDRGLVRSDQGTAPDPPADLAWPWTAELLLVGGLVLACLVVAAVAAVVQVRASDTAQLREGE